MKKEGINKTENSTLHYPAINLFTFRQESGTDPNAKGKGMLRKISNKAGKGRLLAQAAAEQVYASHMEKASRADVHRRHDRLKSDKAYLAELTRLKRVVEMKFRL